MQITPPGGGAGSDTTAVHVGQTTTGNTTVTGYLEVGRLFPDWGMGVFAQDPPQGFAAALSDPGAISWDGTHVPAGDHTYQIDALDAAGGHTLPTDAATVTIPANNTQVVLLTWTDLAETHTSHPQRLYVYRDGELLANIAGTATQYVDTGAVATNPAQVPAAVNGTGGISTQGPVLSQGHPVLTTNVIAPGTITPDKVITVLTADGTAYKVPAVLA